MDTPMMIVFGLLLFTILMLLLDVLRIDLIALIVMLTLGWTRVLSAQETFAGFSSNAVIAMISVMMMSHGLSKTGVVDGFTYWLVEKSGNDKKKIMLFLSLAAGLLSGVMITVGVAAIFLPVVLRVARSQKIQVSELMMPMGFASILGANLTMVGSAPLILLNDLLVSEGMTEYGLLAVFPVGILLLVTGLMYFWIGGSRLLPQKSNGITELTEQEQWMEKLSICRNIEYYQIPSASPLHGKTIESSELWKKYPVHIVAIKEGDQVIWAPWRETQLLAGQFLAIQGQASTVTDFARKHYLEKIEAKKQFPSLADSETAGFVEIMIPPRSPIEGKTLREISFRKRYAVEPLMIFRQGEKVEKDLSDYQLQQGDTLVVHGEWNHIEEMDDRDHFLVITSYEKKSQVLNKSWVAVVCLVMAVWLTIMGIPVSMAFLTSAVLMVLSGVFSIEEAYRVVDWKVVFLLAGLIPLGNAMQKTGAAEWLAEQVIRGIQGGPPSLLLISVAVMASFFSLFMSNVGAVVILVPLVTSMAALEGVDPRPMALLAAVCASNSFMLPTHQVNALLLSPGGYRNMDFVKAGGGMTLLYIMVTVVVFRLFLV
ncbi:Di-and tricarboxylate transporter [Tindallia magadiensis]|uniref:Di-and tricarboxylate transporter n=1 Tax=Tindallia magadiensis TaxID=69895 RepID=A0A1I3EH23_9FIRM|nr:SLC13 family permease [Tindallia magadiensis]SFH98266.1 Di-and tricarboxylate transporter [Tindallia magadiensis]